MPIAIPKMLNTWELEYPNMLTSCIGITMDINGVNRLETTRTRVIGVDDLIIDFKNCLFGFVSMPLFFNEQN